MCRIFYRCVDWNYIYCKKVCVYCFVASFTDAWIETISEGVTERPETVASFTDAWIETTVTSLPGCTILSRIFYRCVDWNLIVLLLYLIISVASFTDAWIETKEKHRQYQHLKVASFTDAWIETEKQLSRITRKSVASFTDAWIETTLQRRVWTCL